MGQPACMTHANVISNYWFVSLTWPDRYLSMGRLRLQYISARRKDTEVFASLCIATCTFPIGHEVIIVAYNFKVKEINTSGWLVGVKNDLFNATTETRPSFFYGRLYYTASDKCPVEKIVVCMASQD